MDIMIIPCVFLMLWIIARKAEAKEWNHGICRQSGLPWVAFDVDSSGATGYSDGLGNTMWK